MSGGKGLFLDDFLFFVSIYVGFNVGQALVVDDGEHFSFGGNFEAVLFGHHHHGDEVLGGDPLFGKGVHFFQSDALEVLLGIVEFAFGTRDGIVVEVVGHVFGGEAFGFRLVGFFLSTLVTVHHLLFGAFQLAFEEAVFQHAVVFAHHDLHHLHNAAFLGHTGVHVGVEVAEEFTVAGVKTYCREVGGLLEFRQTGRIHGVVKFTGHVVLVILHGGHHLVGELADEQHLVAGSFFVGADGYQRFFVVVNRGNDLRTGILLDRNGAEFFLDLFLDGIGVNVADHDHGLQVRTVPVVVETADHFGFEALDDLNQTDGQTFRIAGVGEHDGEPFLAHTVGSAVAHAPLFGNDTALIFNFLRVVQKTVGPSVQDVDTHVDVLLVVGGHGDFEHRFIKTGVGVDAETEDDTDFLKFGNHLVVGITFDAVESHVLGEVGETLLVVILLVGTGVDGETELHAAFGLRVLADVVGHPVFQFPDLYTRVVADLAVQLLRHHGGSAGEDKGNDD